MHNYFQNQKRIRFLFLTIFLVLAVILVFAVILSGASSVVLSHESGFYEDSFYLELSAKEGEVIYYTLDGSVPDENSFVYTEPILISDATPKENLHSARTDVSAGFRGDLIELYQTTDSDPKYRVPDYFVDKCTVIRAISVSPAGITSNISTASYFVGITPESYDGCNIISIVTDPDNLFDYEDGIYVTGAVFENYLNGTTLNTNWRFWSANYTQRGSEWERSAVFHIFDTEGNLLLSKDGGIRTHGGISRGTLPRSLNLYTRKRYDGTSSFGISLFGGTYDPQTATLSSGGNQIITQFNDYMMTEMVRELNIATMLFEPYVMFLGGEYWGFYWLTEKYDEEYFAHYYGVDTGNIVMIKDSALEIGRSGDLSLYHKMLSYITETDMSVEENFAQATAMIDIESCIDYYATMIYIARCEDWPSHNNALWRTRTALDSEYSDGKWRWILYDCNSTSMDDSKGLTEQDTLTYVLRTDPLFASLWKNSRFQETFRERLIYIAQECFNAQKMDAFLTDYAETMSPILSKSWSRFYGSANNKMVEFTAKIESYRTFFLNRKAVVESWFVAG